MSAIGSWVAAPACTAREWRDECSLGSVPLIARSAQAYISAVACSSNLSLARAGSQRLPVSRSSVPGLKEMYPSGRARLIAP